MLILHLLYYVVFFWGDFPVIACVPAISHYGNTLP